MNCQQRRAAARRAAAPEVAGLLQSALAHHLARRPADAEADCRRALQSAPGHPLALQLLGAIVNSEGRAEEALRLIDQAIAGAGGEDPSMLMDRGVALASLGRAAEAVACFDRSLALRPDDAETMQHRGRALVLLHRIDEALACMRQPVALSPDDAWSRLCLGYAELLAGHLREGFALAEWRWWADGFKPLRRDFAQPFWDGEPFAGRTLLIYADQDLGDTIQFCRYATLAAGRGGRVVLEVQPPLVPLLAGLPGAAQVVAKGDALPPFDLQCAMCSLPFLFGTALDTVPAAPSYLHADPARVAAWAPRLPDGGRPRVGLVWSGSRNHLADRDRSMPLSALLPLAGADATFVGLQRGVRAADLPVLGAFPGLVNLGDTFADFADTAAVVAQLDLVITVDTAVAHLAAALGKPTWVLLPHPPEWRWMLDRKDSPWYPTMRLFRQQTGGDWGGVVAQVRAELASMQRPAEPADAAELSPDEAEIVALLREAVAHHQGGRAAAAEAGYRRVLARDPEQPDALHLLGIVALQSGRLEDARALMERSLAADDGNFVVHDNHGRALAALGLLDAALVAFERASAIAPDYPGALFNRAEALAQLGRAAEALAAYDRVLAVQPGMAAAWSGRGNQLVALGRPADAVASFDRAIAIDPAQAGAFTNRGNALYELGKLDEAVASFDRALALRPELAEALSNRGAVLVDLQRPAEGLQSQQRALALRPDHVEARSNQGVALAALDRYEEALDSYDQALAQRPDTANAWSNKGLVLEQLHRDDEAFACYARALALDPEHADARVNLACLELGTGRLAEGWRNYEYRWRRKKLTTPRRDFAQPQWQGEAFAGRTLLLHAEQGFGDTIQLVRYVALAAARGGRVVLEVQSPLLPLLRGLLDVEQVLAYGDDLPPFDLHCPLFSLPLVFGTTLETIPAPHILRADPARAAAWAPLLPPTGRRRIGLAWSGRPTHLNDRNRSMPLAALLPLGEADAAFYGLQKEVRASDAAALAAAPWLVNLGEGFGDFGDAAAVIAQLDLVISVDSALAHLAATLGKPTWVMLPDVADWRWLRARSDSPWYPTARLFRQGRKGDWADVVAQVREALGDVAPAAAPPRMAAAQASADAGALLQAGLQKHQAGRFDEAAHDYRCALAADPGLADAHHLLGVLAYQGGRLEEALGLIDAAIARNPADPGFYSNRGLVLADLRRGAEALSSYDRALALHPGFAEAQSNRGNALRALGRPEEALASYDRALALRPDYAEAWSNRASVLVELGRLEEALAACERALALRPDYAEAWSNRASALADLGRAEEALAACDRALALRPGFSEALANRASVLWRLGRHTEALAGADAAIGLDPEDADAWSNRGAALAALDRPQEAVASYERALALRPDHVEAWSNRGTALAAQLRLGEARASYERALALRPDHAEARFNLASLELLTGDFAAGWRDYEFRWRSRRCTSPRRDFAQPQWHGEELAGRTLLLHAEQGFGDTIQFCRYAPMAAARGARVLLEVQPALVPLLAGLPGVSELPPYGSTLPSFDLHCPLLSLPLAFGTTQETIPAPTPYLHADPVRAARWAARFAGVAGRRVGLVWAGNLSVAVDRQRAMPFAVLRPLLDDAGASFFALQKEVPEDDRTDLAGVPDLANLGPEFADFADTAAAIAQLDLVIAIDTAVAHLAAAMGKPTWVMLRADPDWRWLLGRDDSPWYPSVRLFRQRTPGGWNDVVERVRAALAGTDAGVAGAAPADLLQAALGHHRAGRLAEAEAGYRTVLATAPELADAYHLLGVLAYQRGRLEEALGLIEQAIARNPGDAGYHSNRGLVLADLRRGAEAVASHDEAIALRPDFAEAHSNRGNALRDLGRPEDALVSYGRALALRPDYAEAWSNRGSVEVDLGRFADALSSTDRALALRPDYPEALANRAAILVRLGRPEEAVASADAALALRPDLAPAHDHRGQALLGLQRFDAALASFGDALALAPRLAEAQLGRARALAALGRPAAALAEYDTVLAARPELATAWSDRGGLLTELGRIDEALESFDRALALAPDFADAHYNRALALYAADRREEALAGYDRTIALDPGHVEAWTNRAVVLHDLGRGEEGVDSAEHALALRPDHVQALVNRGTILTKLERHGEAIESFDRALQLAPGMPEVWFDRGVSLVALRRIEEGRACYERALALRPDFAEVHVSMAYLHLAAGDLLDGWREHEWRFRVRAFLIGGREFSQPVWRGEDLAGRTLLIYGEQGFGDTVQFARFIAPTVARATAEGGRVIVETHPALLPLLACLPGVAQLVGYGDELPPFDLRCALMSLPLVHGTTLETLPAPPRYLQADPARVAAWASLLPPGLRRIGLVWSGNPRHGHDRIRSAPLAALQPLADSGVTFVGLQRPVRDADRATLDAATWLVNLGESFADFGDTAAVVEQLDLVIAVDTAVAHVAAALGKPVWVMLAALSDWRWMDGRSDSPWYPSVRLFRQTELGDWADVVERVRQALAAFLGFATPPAAAGEAPEPSDADVVGLLEAGLAQHQAGDLAAAEASYRAALAADPGDADALRLLGTVAHQAGRIDEALALLDQAVAAAPDDPAPPTTRGLLLADLGRLEEALDNFDAALAVEPQFAEAEAARAATLQRLGRLDEAVAGYDAALALEPGVAGRWESRGNALGWLGRADEALASFDRALALQPDLASAWTHRGVALVELDRLDEALESLDRALALAPADADAWSTRGVALARLLHNAEAEAAFDQALALDPGMASAKLNKAYLLLTLGRMQEGWPLHEARWETGQLAREARDLAVPQWRGETLAGRTLLVHAEQGYGDTIQFCRFAVLAAERAAAEGGRVALEVPAPLQPLLADLPGLAEVAAVGGALPAFDLHVPLLSLPLLFGTTLATIPAPPAYLHADPARVERWAPLLIESGQRRIGLAWGRVGYHNDRRRMLPFAELLPLGTVNAAFYGLQAEVREAERAELAAAPWLFNLGELFGDFADTAAVIERLDLVITADTAVAHLAGAMGKPTWLLLPYAPDWRWLLGRDDSPWYPSMRLFRQSRRGDWAEVVARVLQALAPAAAAPEFSPPVLPPLPLPAAASRPELRQQAVAQFQAGRLAEAEAGVRRVLDLAPDDAEALHLLGVIAFQSGRKQEAIELLDRAAASGGPAAAFSDRGLVLADVGWLEEAVASYGRALALDPDMVDAYTNRAAALSRLGRAQEAVVSLDQALAMRPDAAEAWSNRGVLLTDLGRWRAAEASYDRAVGLNPDFAEGWCNRGVMLGWLGRVEEAQASFDRAIMLRPDYADAHFNKAFAALRAGRFREGWPDYEWRWRMPHFTMRPRNFPQPQWYGEGLAGRTILLHAEQGFGDTIQFCRYVPMVAARGGVVIVEAPAPVLPLLADLPGLAARVAYGDALPAFDLHCPLMSLPLAFGTTPATIPAPGAYLRADPARVARWAPRFAGAAGPRVGFVWAGNRTKPADPKRSMPLATMRPLLEFGGTVFALQRDVPAADRDDLAAMPAVADIGADFADFADTAAAIAHLDLVISIDTAVAHLAATMGKPTWTLLHAAADWRWLTGRDDSPWYPAMRLFRQTAPGDWAAVVARVGAELGEFCRAWRSSRTEAGRPAAFAPPPEPAAPAALSAAQLLQVGLGHLQAGRMAEAEAAYRQVLAAEPDNADALHLLGIAAYQTGRLAEAAELIGRAVAANLANPAVLNNHGLVLADLRRPEEALDRYDRALALAPGFAEAHSNRGNALRDLRRLEEALDSYGRAVALRPDYAEAWSNRAITLVDLGRADEALASADRALAAQPDLAAAHCNRGAALQALHRPAEALENFDRAVALLPDYPEAWVRRADVLAMLGRIDEALAGIDQAIARAPGDTGLRDTGLQVARGKLLALRDGAARERG